MIWQKTDLGFKAIVENKFSGLLYDNEIFQPLETGMRLKAYVKQAVSYTHLRHVGIHTVSAGVVNQYGTMFGNGFTKLFCGTCAG